MGWLRPAAPDPTVTIPGATFPALPTSYSLAGRARCRPHVSPRDPTAHRLNWETSHARIRIAARDPGHSRIRLRRPGGAGIVWLRSRMGGAAPRGRSSLPCPPPVRLLYGRILGPVTIEGHRPAGQSLTVMGLGPAHHGECPATQ